MKEIVADFQTPNEFVERFINQTNASIFLTGKAGTGKTTLLKKIINTTHKNTVVVAPTGIAAINAGGVTIHSFFQLPFGGFLPIDGTSPYVGGMPFNTKTTLQKNHFKIRKDRRNTIREMELLIIDEVSMLRADLLDAIDFTLQVIRRNNFPFGGVQVLFIGDLLQLPPIIKNNEQSVFNQYYRGSFFFHARVIESFPPLYIELEKIYRQSDPIFIEILDELRNNKISEESVAILNQYVHPDFDSTEHEGFITITTHNAKADEINQKSLDALEGKKIKYEAEINKNFPESSYPIPLQLELKVGAQVMFIKNDVSFEKRYFNGKIGKVVSLRKEEIKVLLPDENKIINVEPYVWENIKYEVEESSGKITEKVLGTFTFYPLRLAWAITVHKSQGLTFEKAVLDLSRVFAPGQAYVGLSRMTGLEGLVLKTPIQLNGLSNSQDVMNYAQNKATKELLSEKLDTETVGYLKDRLQKSFNWNGLMSKWFELESQHKAAGDRSVISKNAPWVHTQVQQLMKTLEPARKFRDWILKYCTSPSFELAYFHERVEAAYDYFMKTLEATFQSNVKQILLSQKQAGTKQYIEDLMEIDELMTKAILELKTSLKLVQSMAKNQELTKSQIWDEQIQNFKARKVQVIKDEIRAKNPTLDDMFSDVSVFQKKEEKQREPKVKKKPTHIETLELFEKGYSIQEIADRRTLKLTTIYSHLAKLITENLLDLEKILSPEKIQYLQNEIKPETEESLSEIKERLGKKISWEELKLFRAKRAE